MISGEIFDVPNYMKHFVLFLLLGSFYFSTVYAQPITLKKGIIVDSLQVIGDDEEYFAVYLPTTFDQTSRWPVVIFFDLQGRGKQVLRLFQETAERQGYILAASNNINDSLSLSQNVLISNRLITDLKTLFPIHNDRIYTAGFSRGGKMASMMPVFINGISGALSYGAPIPNTELLNNKNPFQFIGIVGTEDFNYSEMLVTEKALNRLKFPNQLLLFEGSHEWPKQPYLDKAFEILSLSAMAKGHIPRDSIYIEQTFNQNVKEIDQFLASGKWLHANHLMEEVISVYRFHMPMDSLIDRNKDLRKDKLFKASKRSQNAVFFKENLIKEDYVYYLEEDILTYNYNNLGWWTYQMNELKKYGDSKNFAERQMGSRLMGYINALVEDYINLEKSEKIVDSEALLFLYMLKTITDPQDYAAYLNVISESARLEDFGTALFYLEELLKNGYKDKPRLYDLDHTALLRITPEYNEIVAKYLKDARFDFIEE